MPSTKTAIRTLSESWGGIRLSPYVPHAPHDKQWLFLSDGVNAVREVLFGGAAGGGKSDALLMAALQFSDVPGYSALILRRTYQELALPGALMDRARLWLSGTDAHWLDRDHRWVFPSGATLTFGYLEHDGDEERYASAEFQYVGFDELTQFSERQYTFLFSRLRRVEGIAAPLRMRGATNPVGHGKAWVHRRFILSGRSRGRLFIASRLEDNPSLDPVEYDESLREMYPLEYRQLRLGDWEAKPEGKMFKRGDFDVVPAEDVPATARRVRYWDLAATEQTTKGSAAKRVGDPDWTAGLRLARSQDGIYFVEDVVRVRRNPIEVEQIIAATAESDGRPVPIRMEQEGGASGKSLISHYRRNVLDGFAFEGVRATGSKETRAAPVSARTAAGEVRLVAGPWIEAFLDELAEFPDGTHDDQVDALSGAFEFLAGKARRARPVEPVSFTGGSHWRT